MTDNGSDYRSRVFRDLLGERSIKHERTRPYTPRTNGKAERFIQTSLREWAYAQPFTTSAERASAMQPWISVYNAARPHSALGTKSPLDWIAARNIEMTTAGQIRYRARLR
jgi:transposase InsO family protein